MFELDTQVGAATDQRRCLGLGPQAQDLFNRSGPPEDIAGEGAVTGRSGRTCAGGTGALCGCDDGVDDLGVSGAAAEVAGNGTARGATIRRWIIVKKVTSGQDESRGAEAALHGAGLGEGFDKGPPDGIALDSFDCRDPLPIDLARHGEAGGHRAPVEQHGAGTALAFATPVLGPAQSEGVAKHRQERVPRVDVHRRRRAIDLEPKAHRPASPEPFRPSEATR